MSGIRPFIVSIVLVLGTAGLAAPAAAGYQDSPSERFVLGGGHATVEPVPDTVQLLDVDQAAAVATCGIQDVGPHPPLGIPEPGVSASMGGACLPVPDAADEQIRVYVDRLLPDAYVPIGVAAGYDGDRDGCVGCTAEDEVWRGQTTLTLPILEGQRWVMVFVYAVDVDVSSYPGPTTATVGEITVTPADERPPCGEEEVSIPGTHCQKVPEDEAEPHLCVPACIPVIDTPA